MSDKIRDEHLRRRAFVYIRQSSMEQVRNNPESRRRQYGLADKARSMGWNDVEVIDEDLGRSGASAVDRTGFQRLVAEVGLGRCGAVFSLEASRLARNNADWYRLLDLCSLARTLIIDSEAVYDPRLGNDRLLLGLKGALSEAELGLIFQRAQRGALSKARRGELYTTVPVGYLRTRDDGVEMDPDRRVRESVQGVFDKFAETGSARQTLLWYRQEKIRLPARRHGRWGWETVWKVPVYNTVLKLLKNPIYAGAYVWGRTVTETVVEDGTARKRAGRLKPPEEWTVWIREHHEGYVDWKTFERNQAILGDNTNMKGAMAMGAARRGRGLLAGLLSCGHCGRRLHVAYSGLGGMVPRYRCQGAQFNHGGAKCISFGGLRIDRAVEEEILRVVAPAGVEAALAAAEKAGEESRLKRSLLERELEQLRYEAERAYRQYDSVDPANRLVADSLEAKWNDALTALRRAEERLEGLDREERRMEKPDRLSLLCLARDLPKLWADPRTDMKTKKRIARTLIEEITVQVDEIERRIELVIRWRGGRHTRLRFNRNKTGHHAYCTDRDVIDLVRELATHVADKDIARILNRLGKKTGRGNSWTQSRVCSLRCIHRIPVFDADAAAGVVCHMQAAARILGISPTSVRGLVEKGILPARQAVPTAPWRIQLADLESAAVLAAVKSLKSARRLPPPVSADQLSLIK